MAKHLFSFAYSRLRHNGEILKETPHTYVAGGRTRPTRFLKARNQTVLETDDPDAVCEAFRSAYTAQAGRIAKMQEELLAAQHEQLVAAFKAAGLINPFASDSKASESTD